MATSDSGPKPTAHEIEPGCSLPGRRRFLKQSAGAVATIATAGAASSTVLADDDDDIMGGTGPGSGPDGDLTDITAAIGSLYDSLSGLFSSGYDKEDVEGMVAENTHLQIYEMAESGVESIQDFTTEASNWVNPNEPETSELAELAWSEVRTAALRGLQEGNSAGDIRVEAREDAYDELSTPIQNYIRQSNQHVYDIVRALFTFVDEDDIPWSEDDQEDIDHTEGDTLAGFDEIDLTEHEIGADNGDEAVLEPDEVIGVLSTNNNLDDATFGSFDDFRLEVKEFELPNGETEDYYEFVTESISANRDLDEHHISAPWYLEEEYDTYVHLGINHLEDGAEEALPLGTFHADSDNGFGNAFRDEFNRSDEHLAIVPLIEAVEEIADEIQSDADSYVDDIFDAHSQGDVEDMDIVSSYDLMREYSDAGGLGRVAAEAMAMGLAHPDDVETEVEIDSSAFDDPKTGGLFLDWDFETLETWEYSYSASDQELELDSRTSFEAGFIELEFHEDGDSDEDYTVEVDIEDITDGVIDLSDDVDEDDELDDIIVDAEGEVQSFIPVGEDTDNFDHALFWDEDEEEQLSISPDDGIELLEVEGDDEDTHLDLETYQAETLDADRSVDQAAHDSDQYVSVDDLDEAGVDLPGLPSVPDLGQGASLLGLGLIGVVILAVIGFVTDLIPGLGN